MNGINNCDESVFFGPDVWYKVIESLRQLNPKSVQPNVIESLSHIEPGEVNL